MLQRSESKNNELGHKPLKCTEVFTGGQVLNNTFCIGMAKVTNYLLTFIISNTWKRFCILSIFKVFNDFHFSLCLHLFFYSYGFYSTGILCYSTFPLLSTLFRSYCRSNNKRNWIVNDIYSVAPAALLLCRHFREFRFLSLLINKLLIAWYQRYSNVNFMVNFMFRISGKHFASFYSLIVIKQCRQFFSFFGVCHS